jgi:hypothetical protein
LKESERLKKKKEDLDGSSSWVLKGLIEEAWRRRTVRMRTGFLFC